jgi:hypothetical protein
MAGPAEELDGCEWMAGEVSAWGREHIGDRSEGWSYGGFSQEMAGRS